MSAFFFLNIFASFLGDLRIAAAAIRETLGGVTASRDWNLK